VSGSVLDIWDYLEELREYQKGYPKLIARGETPDSPRVQYALRGGAELAREFNAQIWKAVTEGDRAYIGNLYKAMGYARKPLPEMNGIQAALKAFWDLFISPAYKSKDDWPTKQEVRRRAEEILQKAGCILPGERQWPRIFKNAGLWNLPSVTYGRARKRKKN
jgi:hypothetical protein